VQGTILQSQQRLSKERTRDLAVEIRFITIVTRRDAIEARVPGGWIGWLETHKRRIGKTCWHDEHLFATSSMNHHDTSRQLNDYKELGLISMSQNSEGDDEWQDMCVLEILSFPRQCPWLEVVSDEMQFGSLAVKLTGTADDAPVGPTW